MNLFPLELVIVGSRVAIEEEKKKYEKKISDIDTL